jgi:hypothetical protein
MKRRRYASDRERTMLQRCSGAREKIARARLSHRDATKRKCAQAASPSTETEQS